MSPGWTLVFCALATAGLAAIAAPALAGPDGAPGGKAAGVVPGPAPGLKAAPAPPAVAVMPQRAAGDTAAPVIGDSLGEPRLYLSWNAPYGMPRAADRVVVDCLDTTRVDTLYLSFETGRDASRFYGMYARLYFHPAQGDTLGTYWHWERGWWNQGNLRVEFDPDGTFPCAQPWTRGGFGAPSYEFKPEFGTLDLVYAVKEQDAAPISGTTRYCFGRVMLRQRKCALPGSMRPVCLEWSSARYSFGAGDVAVTRGGERFVSVNSDDGGVCAPYRAAVRPQRWLPRSQPAPGSPTPVTVPVVPGGSTPAVRDSAARPPG